MPAVLIVNIVRLDLPHTLLQAICTAQSLKENIVNNNVSMSNAVYLAESWTKSQSVYRYLVNDRAAGRARADSEQQLDQGTVDQSGSVVAMLRQSQDKHTLPGHRSIDQMRLRQLQLTC